MPYMPLTMPYPLKIVGGKAQLIQQLIKIIDDCILKHNLVGVIDACMGGNRIFLTHQPELELELKIANEKDLGTVNFFRCLQDPYLTDQLIDEICLTWDLYTNEKAFIEGRKIRRNPSTPIVESAALTYILTEFGRAANKTIFCEANANRGIDPKSLDKFLHLEELLEDVEIRHGDCLDITKEFADRDDILMFLDVPYLEEGKKTGEAKATQDYEDKFAPKDQEELLNTLLVTKNKVILCGYENPIYKKRLEDNISSGFKKYFIGEVNVSSAANGRKRKEYIWCNFDFDEDLLPEESSDDDL
jgi:site-specific DNA-adenine methylase